MFFRCFCRCSGCRNLPCFQPNKIWRFHIFLAQPIPPIPQLLSISLWQMDFEIIWDVVPEHRGRKVGYTWFRKKPVRINFDMLGCLKEIAHTKQKGVEKHPFGHLVMFINSHVMLQSDLDFIYSSFIIIPWLEHNHFAKPYHSNDTCHQTTRARLSLAFHFLFRFEKKTSVWNKDVKFQTLRENQPWRPAFLPGFLHFGAQHFFQHRQRWQSPIFLTFMFFLTSMGLQNLHL